MIPQLQSPSEKALEALQNHEKNAAFVDYATYDEQVANLKRTIVFEHVDKLFADIKVRSDKKLRKTDNG